VPNKEPYLGHSCGAFGADSNLGLRHSMGVSWSDPAAESSEGRSTGDGDLGNENAVGDKTHTSSAIESAMDIRTKWKVGAIAVLVIHILVRPTPSSVKSLPGKARLSALRVGLRAAGWSINQQGDSVWERPRRGAPAGSFHRYCSADRAHAQKHPGSRLQSKPSLKI
jgi:hypothetical protein